MTLVAPRIVNDVSYVRRINHEIHFAWQAEYLVDLDCYFSLFLAGAAFREILGDSRSAKCRFFHTKCHSKMGRVRSPKRRVQDDDFSVGLSLDHDQIAFILAEAIQRVSAEISNLRFRGRRSIW